MKKSRRILGVLLCCMLLVGLLPTVAFATTTYDVWVDGGTQVTSDNAADILGDGTASYDPATNTLTLSGYDGSYIKANTALDIVLADGTENAVSVPVDVEEYGIYTYGDCTIRGNGNLNIEVLHPDHDGVWANYGDLTVDMTGNLTVNAGDDGLYADNDLTISGSGDITVTAGGDGFCAYSGSVAISGSGDITVTSGYGGLYANKDLTISGSGDITVTAGDYGFFANCGSVAISGNGNITVTADDDGIIAYEDVNLSGSRNIVITAGYDGISAGDDVEINDTCKVSASSGSYHAVRLWNSGSKLLLNGTGAPISLKAGTGVAAVWNEYDSNSPVGGTNIANYDVTGAPDTDSVVYTLKSGAPVKITEVHVTGMPTTIAAGASTAISASDVTITTVPADAADVVEICWWNNNTPNAKDDTTFNADYEYQLGVRLSPKDGYYFEFDDTYDERYTGEATFNGGPAKEAWTYNFGLSDLGMYSQIMTPIVSYTVTVQNDGNGTASANPASAAKGDTVTLTATPNTGYHFKEWQSSDVTVTGNTFTMPEKNVTVKAIFEADAPTTYTVTFNMNGHGTQISAQTVEEGNKATKPADPSASGYTFDGWYADATFSAKFDFNSAINADTTVYAKWTENTVTPPAPVNYTVTYNMNGHGTQITAQTVEGGSKATKPADPTAEGWTFGGWFADATFSVEFDFDAAINANTTVYAKWTENTVPQPPVPEKFTVSFNMNGHGTQVAEQTVEEGNKTTKPADPSACGYTFDGWYADATFSTKFDFNTAITANTTVYAKWTKNSVAPTDPTSPQTGDNSHMFLWIALLFVSGSALVGTTVYGKKRKRAE